MSAAVSGVADMHSPPGSGPPARAADHSTGPRVPGRNALAERSYLLRRATRKKVTQRSASGLARAFRGGLARANPRLGRTNRGLGRANPGLDGAVPGLEVAVSGLAGAV